MLKIETCTVFHTTGMSNFPTMKACYCTPAGKIFRYSYHDAKELSGHQVRDVLMDDLGLTEKEALEVLR